jgi:hypothetical protein
MLLLFKFSLIFLIKGGRGNNDITKCWSPQRGMDMKEIYLKRTIQGRLVLLHKEKKEGNRCKNLAMPADGVWGGD